MKNRFVKAIPEGGGRLKIKVLPKAATKAARQVRAILEEVARIQCETPDGVVVHRAVAEKLKIPLSFVTQVLAELWDDPENLVSHFEHLLTGE